MELNKLQVEHGRIRYKVEYDSETALITHPEGKSVPDIVVQAVRKRLGNEIGIVFEYDKVDEVEPGELGGLAPVEPCSEEVGNETEDR